MSDDHQYPFLVKPAQAVFGILWALWYSNITLSIINARHLARPLFVLGFPLSLQIVKAFYIVTSLVCLVIALDQLSLLLDDARALARKLPETAFYEGVRPFRELGARSIVLLIAIACYLAYTYWLFRDSINAWLPVFGVAQLAIWILWALVGIALGRASDDAENPAGRVQPSAN